MEGRKLLPEEEWYLFSTEDSKQLLSIFIKAKKNASMELPEEIFASFLLRVERIFPRASSVLSSRPLSLVLLEMRVLEYSEKELILYRRLHTLGARTKAGLQIKRLSNEGWIYGGIKDLMRNRKKQAVSLSKALKKALEEDIYRENIYPWNSFFGYTFICREDRERVHN